MNCSDIIGDAGDVAGSLHILEEHIHTPAHQYPSLADGVTVTATSGAGTWTLGTKVEIVPADTITDAFDIHFISIEDISANGQFEMHLFEGPSDNFIGSIRFVRNTLQNATINVPIQTPIVAANQRIRAALASSDDGGQTVDISLFYHEY